MILNKLVSFVLSLTELCFQILSSFSLSEKSKYHSVWLYEMWNSCTRVFQITCILEQQELNKTEEEGEK